MATDDQIILEWQKMKAAYPSSFVRASDDDITGNQLVWIEQLADIDSALLSAACAQYRSSPAEWFPSAGKIRNIALELSTPATRRTGLEAWGDVIKAISDVGYYRVPYFTDTIVSEVVKSLGWQNLCISENQMSDRARFIDAYNSMLERKRDTALMLPEVERIVQLSRVGYEIKRLADAKSM